MDTPLRLIAVGPHGAGKSTLGAALAARHGFACVPEIGRLHRDRALARGHHALTRDPAFDRGVIGAELRRDRRLPQRAVVETWHPGNLAYARARSPQVARRMMERLRLAATGLSGAVIVPVTASAAVLAERLNEPGGTPAERLAFFSAVAADALRIAEAWGLTVLPPIDTSLRAPAACADAVLDRLDGRADTHWAVRSGR